MSTDSIFDGIDAAISGRAADASKASKERKIAAGGQSASDFTSTLIGHLTGTKPLDGVAAKSADSGVAPPSPAVQPGAASTPADQKAAAAPTSTAMKEGTTQAQTEKAQQPEPAAASALDAATNPADAAKKSGDDTVKLLLKMFGI